MRRNACWPGLNVSTPGVGGNSISRPIEAHADKSMALLGRPVAVDLTKTPILCWQWQIDAPVASAGVKRACSWLGPGVADPGS